jgi:NAD(P)-dependent dehydrogenase (short-subunit alcohol dehydrogenase family)
VLVNNAGYSQSGAVEALSDVLHFEVQGFGVEVLVIEPELIRTGFAETAVGSMDGSDGETRMQASIKPSRGQLRRTTSGIPSRVLAVDQRRSPRP